MEDVGDVVESCWEVLLALLMLVDVGDAVDLLLNSIEVEPRTRPRRCRNSEAAAAWRDVGRG